MLSSDGYIHFFSLLFFLLKAENPIISPDTHKVHPIKHQPKDIWPEIRFHLPAQIYLFFFIFFCFLLNNLTVSAHVKSSNAALKPRSAQFLLECPAPGGRSEGRVDRHRSCLARSQLKYRLTESEKGIIVQRLRDWIGVKATQLAQRKK